MTDLRQMMARCTAAATLLWTTVALAQDALPPLDDALVPPGQLSGQLQIIVDRFDFEGHRVFSTDELRQIVRDWTGKPITTEGLEEARLAVTKAYIARGYINSGATIPDQDVDGAEVVVLIRVVEGRLTQINISGNKHLKTAYLESRVRRGAALLAATSSGTSEGGAMNVNALRDNLELIRQNPNVQRFNAELKPGGLPGESILDLAVTEETPYQLGLRWDNHNPPSTGAEKLSILASHSSLTGVSDSLSLIYGVTKGGIEEPEFAGLDDITIEYARPITDSDLTFSIGYSRSSTLIVEDTFVGLDIESESQDFWLGLRQPVWRTPTTEFALGLQFMVRDNETTLGGDPFSFEPGANDGKTQLSVLRIIQEFIHRTDRQAFAARSTFSIGLPIFGATENASNIPDGEFFTWLGQAQYVHRLFDTQAQLVGRVAAQLADDNLLALEQIAVGGVNSVRGYRENQLVRDQALLGTIEVRIPIVTDVNGREQFTLVPFFDIGHGYNAGSVSDSDTIASVGLGFILTPNRHINVELFWGYAFKDFDTPEDNLQDAGLHFAVTLLWF